MHFGRLSGQKVPSCGKLTACEYTSPASISFVPTSTMWPVIDSGCGQLPLSASTYGHVGLPPFVKLISIWFPTRGIRCGPKLASVPARLMASVLLIPCAILNASMNAGSSPSFSGHVRFGRSSTPRMESAASGVPNPDRKSTRLNSSHGSISYAVFCLKKKKRNEKGYQYNLNSTNPLYLQKT